MFCLNFGICERNVSILACIISCLPSCHPIVLSWHQNTVIECGRIQSSQIQGIGVAVREIVERYSTFEHPLTFIIDDADLAFDQDYGNLDKKAARMLLELFVDITKKTNNVCIRIIL